jgi:hypothetical protein
MFLALIWDCNKNQKEIRTKFSWYRAKLSLGVLVGPALFNQPSVAPHCDMNGQEERTQAAKMQKRADCGNVGLILG